MVHCIIWYISYADVKNSYYTVTRLGPELAQLQEEIN